MKSYIGVDLGTANTLVYKKGKGIILREPSVVAVDERTGKSICVGNAAKEMIGRTPNYIKAVRPLKDGVIADFQCTIEMLKVFIKKAIGSSFFTSTYVVICVPSGVTQVERMAVEDAAKQAGAKDVRLITEPKAAAIGADLPVSDPIGSMVVDIGGGTSEIAVLSLGGIVVSQSVRVAGDEFNDSIIAYIRKKYNILIGERTAEDLKIGIGSAYEYEDEGSMDIRGRDLLNGLPKSLVITAAEVREALVEPLSRIIDAIKSTLEETPPELSADIITNGIMITGGGALLKGLDKLISQETGIEVKIAESPLDCVALGSGKVLDDFNVTRSSVFESDF